MKTVAQSVIKKISEVIIKVPKKISLHVSLIISTVGRKNYASMAEENGLSYRKVRIKKSDVGEYERACKKFLQETVHKLSTKEEPGDLILDFSFLQKLFSQQIPDVTYDYNGVGKRVSKGFSAGFIFWSNGKATIPLDHVLWRRKKDAGALYKKKTELAKELIKWAKDTKIPFREVKMDGAFASQDMIAFLISEKISFTMRIPSNRVVSTDTCTEQLAKHPGLKLVRNEKYKTIVASYKGMSCYFTAHKRIGNRGAPEVVFIVSDVARSPKQHVRAYAERWPAEKGFRTKKQHLGITDCQSTNAAKQRVHIFSVMVAYTLLEIIKIDKKQQSPEAVLHLIRRQKKLSLLSHYLDLEQTIMN